MTNKRITTALAALALAGLLGGCGDGGSDEGGPASLDPDAAASDNSDNSAGGEEPTAQERGDAFLEYSQCMRDHGVNVPDPETGEDGVVEIPDRLPDLAATGGSAETIAAAEAACQPILDAVDAFGERPNAQEIAEAMDQATAVAQCMRAKGYDMADPQVDAMGRVQQLAPLGRDVSQEQLDRLMADTEACMDEVGLEPPTTEVDG